MPVLPVQYASFASQYILAMITCLNAGMLANCYTGKLAHWQTVPNLLSIQLLILLMTRLFDSGLKCGIMVAWTVDLFSMSLRGIAQAKNHTSHLSCLDFERQ